MQPVPEPAAPVPAEPSEADYDAFCATVMASARGRWFLAEYARRHRKADTDAVLAALHRVEDLVRGAPAAEPLARVRDEVRAVAAMVREAKRELGSGTATISTATKVMGLLTLLEERIGHILTPGDDRVPLPPPDVAPEARQPMAVEAFASQPEVRPDTARARLSVVAETPQPAAVARPEPPPSPSAALLPPLDPGEAHPNLVVLPLKAAAPPAPAARIDPPAPRIEPPPAPAPPPKPVAVVQTPVQPAKVQQPAPAKFADTFADVMALSEEERIALFT